MVLGFDGTTHSTTLNSGGTQIVFSGGVAFQTDVKSGGRQVHRRICHRIWNWRRGISDRPKVEGGGVEFVFGDASSTTINGTPTASGTMVVWSGGFADGSVINANGFEFVVGSSVDVTVNKGGTQFVVSGGEADGVAINAGGTQVISNGSVFGDFVALGGNVIVGAGGTEFFTTVSGAETVLAGGTTSGSDIHAGGLEVVSAGGNAADVTIDGGLLVVRAGGSATITFDADTGGRVELAGQSFTGNIAGFASPPGVTEQIDLVDINFITGTTKVSFTEAAGNTSGTLTVTNGSQTANLTLLGFYSTGNFQIASDGHGGTLVTDPPTMVGSATNPTLAGHG